MIELNTSQLLPGSLCHSQCRWWSGRCTCQFEAAAGLVLALLRSSKSNFAVPPGHFFWLLPGDLSALARTGDLSILILSSSLQRWHTVCIVVQKGCGSWKNRTLSGPDYEIPKPLACGKASGKLWTFPDAVELATAFGMWITALKVRRLSGSPEAFIQFYTLTPTKSSSPRVCQDQARSFHRRGWVFCRWCSPSLSRCRPD